MISIEVEDEGPIETELECGDILVKKTDKVFGYHVCVRACENIHITINEFFR